MHHMGVKWVCREYGILSRGGWKYGERWYLLESGDFHSCGRIFNNTDYDVPYQRFFSIFPLR